MEEYFEFKVEASAGIQLRIEKCIDYSIFVKKHKLYVQTCNEDLKEQHLYEFTDGIVKEISFDDYPK